MSQEQKQTRIAFQTFGCRSNFADTIDLQAAITEKGAVACGIDSEADVYVINTCTVTDNADKDAYKLIKKTREKNPNAKIVVTGCMAEVDQQKIIETGHVDFVVGPGRKNEIISSIFTAENSLVESNLLLEGNRRKKPKRSSISLDFKMSPAVVGPGDFIGEQKSRARYHLRVQEGCENSCTFCIIPFSRGKYSSRKLEQILEDFDRLEELGFREIVLTGTHLGGWGEDIGLELIDLLRAIEERADSKSNNYKDLSGLARVRLSSIDPEDVSKDLVDLISKSNVFCQHLHICMQAFSEATLKRMNRRALLKDAVETLWYINKKMPLCCIGSDLICGFPGESREELERGIELFLGLPISYLHVFPYSERSGTAATRLDGEVPFKERKRRAARLRALAQNKRKEFSLQFIGKDVEIVVEELREIETKNKTECAFVASGTTEHYVSAECEFLFHGKAEELPKIGSKFSVKAAKWDEIKDKLICHL